METTTVMIECPRCEGVGEVEKFCDSPDPQDGGHMVTCRDCKGDGEVEDEDATALLELRAEHAFAISELRLRVVRLQRWGADSGARPREIAADLRDRCHSLADQGDVYADVETPNILRLASGEVDSLWARVQDLTGGTGGDRLKAAVLAEPDSTPGDAFPSDWDLPY